MLGSYVSGEIGIEDDGEVGLEVWGGVSYMGGRIVVKYYNGWFNVIIDEILFWGINRSFGTEVYTSVVGKVNMSKVYSVCRLVEVYIEVFE